MENFARQLEQVNERDAEIYREASKILQDKETYLKELEIYEAAIKKDEDECLYASPISLYIESMSDWKCEHEDEDDFDDEDDEEKKLHSDPFYDFIEFRPCTLEEIKQIEKEYRELIGEKIYEENDEEEDDIEFTYRTGAETNTTFRFFKPV